MSSSFYESIDVHIRWSDRQDLIIQLAPADTVQALKDKIRQSIQQLDDKHLRLIHNGRVLQNNKRLSDYDIGRLPENNTKAKIPPPSPVFIHCSVSEHPSTRPNDQPQMTPPIGFDRLLEAGFSEQDVNNIRAQFHRMHGDGEESSEQARQLEEQWMDNTGETLPDGSKKNFQKKRRDHALTRVFFYEAVQGTYKEMFVGMIFGFFLGILCLFWLRESVFNRRHQIGITAGILINISFGLLHVHYN
ncbi:DUF2407 C-terminal domain-containing protein [Gongronella butleri]|nr:DUF2407 C-terminal domain-containing protein [Gongronella butleri]